MNIQSTTITAYQLTLSESEMRAAIADPHSMVTHLKAALGETEELGGKLPKSPRRKIGKGKVATLRQQAKAIGRKAGPKRTAVKAAKEECPVCHKSYGYLKTHMDRKHPGYNPGA